MNEPSFSNAKVAEAEIAQRIQQNLKRIQQGIAAVTTSNSDLGAMPAQYGPIVDYINQLAVDNPNDAGVQSLKANVDRMIIEFNELQATAQQIVNAIDAVINPE